MDFAELRSRLEGIEGGQQRFKAYCPGHGEKPGSQKSLSVFPGDNGNIIVKCHSVGCSRETILKAIGLWKTKKYSDMGKPISEYFYRDQTGKILFKVVRYEPKDFRPFVPCSTGWKIGLGKVKRVPYRIPDWFQKTESILIVEGEKDADNLFKFGFPATCNQGGSENWKDNLAEWFADLNIVICPDNDPAGKKWTDVVGRSLSGKAKSVRVLCLPVKEKGDISDWIESGGTHEEMIKLIDESKEWRDEEKNEKKESGFNLTRILNKINLSNWVHVHGHGFYHWREEGYWECMNDSQVKYFLREFIPEKYRKRNNYNDILHEMGIHTLLISGQMNHDRRMINLKDGMYDYISDKLQVHDRKHHSTVQISIDWKDDSKCPVWHDFLNEVLEESQCIECLQEFMGLCFTPLQCFEKAAILYGKGQNGKSKVINILKYLIGPDNTCSVGFFDLQKEHPRVLLVDKLLNSATEIPQKEVNVEMFKAIVSGEPIATSHKNKPNFNFNPICKMIFAGNHLPKSGDTSFGLFRRLLIFPFDNEVPEEKKDIFLDEKLVGEAAGIFHWCMIGLRRLLQNRKFTKSPKMNRVLYDYKLSSSNILQFAQDCLTFQDKENTTCVGVYTKQLYNVYLQWCETDGMCRPLPRVAFMMELRKEFKDDFVKSRKRPSSFERHGMTYLTDREYFIESIGLKNEPEELSHPY